MINKAILTARQEKQFWSKVGVEGSMECWLWTGAKKPKGYGNVRINKEYRLAHRVAWELSTGAIIPSGLVVMHICDNPSCCNPAHLVLGTIKANTYDMIVKGRAGFRKNKASGECNGNSKLTATEVLEIRKVYSEGCASQGVLGNTYGVAQTTIGRIVNSDTWRNL